MARTDSYPNFFHDVSEAFRMATGKTTVIKPCDYDTEIANLSGGNVGDISEYFEENISKGTPGTYKGGWQLAIKKLPPFKFSGTDATGLFYNYPCDNPDLSQIDTSNCKNMSKMFFYSSKIKNLDISGLNTQNVEDISQMFMTTSIKQLDMSNLDFSKVNNTVDMFSYCNYLTELIFAKNLGKGFNSTSNNDKVHTVALYSTKLTTESLMSVINKLYDLNLTYNVESGGTLHPQQLKLGSSHLAKLTAEQLTIATNKGWTVS